MMLWRHIYYNFMSNIRMQNWQTTCVNDRWLFVNYIILPQAMQCHNRNIIKKNYNSYNKLSRLEFYAPSIHCCCVYHHHEPSATTACFYCQIARVYRATYISLFFFATNFLPSSLSRCVVMF